MTIKEIGMSITGAVVGAGFTAIVVTAPQTPVPVTETVAVVGGEAAGATPTPAPVMESVPTPVIINTPKLKAAAVPAPAPYATTTTSSPVVFWIGPDAVNNQTCIRKATSTETSLCTQASIIWRCGPALK